MKKVGATFMEDAQVDLSTVKRRKSALSTDQGTKYFLLRRIKNISALSLPASSLLISY